MHKNYQFYGVLVAVSALELYNLEILNQPSLRFMNFKIINFKEIKGDSMIFIFLVEFLCETLPISW